MKYPATAVPPASAGTATAASSAAKNAATAAWTCPFCSLLCDSFHVETRGANIPLALVGSHCQRAGAALARFSVQPLSAESLTPPATPSVDGVACDLDTAVAAAAQHLAASRQPLFGGLGTDVAGARALYALACATGAISDAANGEALQQTLNVMQERGGYGTTQAEVVTRADVIVCIGGLPTALHPEFFDRHHIGTRSVHAASAGIGDSDGEVAMRRVFVLAPADAVLPRTVNGVALEHVPFVGDLFDTLALLAARVEGRPLRREANAASGGLATLCNTLKAASYAVLVWQAAALPAQGALAVEAVNRIVATLNRSTRAAALPLGGGDGAATVNQVFTWLSGLPLRSRAGPLGLEHEPLRFDAARLLAERSVDALLWVASFGTEPPPPPAAEAGLPTVLLGHPSLQASLPNSAAPGTVFIPVSTPGIGSFGHLFRTDGVVLMPLPPVHADGLPMVAEVVTRLTHAVRAIKAAEPVGAAP